MEILNNYVKAIKPLLPKSQRDDIIKELSENLLSRMEDKEAELGRLLTEAEQEAILNEHGHPLLVAGRYRQDGRNFSFGRQLIGPELFPFYVKCLWLVLGLTVVIFVTSAITRLAGGDPSREILKSVFGFPGVWLPLVVQFVVLTLVFVLVEFYQRSLPQGWYVPTTQSKPIPRRHSATGVVVWTALVLWWLLVPRFPSLIFGPAADGLGLGPAWHTFHVPVLLLLLAGLAQRTINLLRPRWTFFLCATRSVIDGVGSALALYMLWNPQAHIFVVANVSKNAEHYERLAQIFNQTILWVVLSWLGFALLALTIIYALICGERLRRGMHRSADAGRHGLAAPSKGADPR